MTGRRGWVVKRQDDKCPKCGATQWKFTTDAMTGSTFARCGTCGAHLLSSPHGFVDWALGLALDSDAVVGSAWTQHVTPQLFPDLSRLSHP